jgi:two-component sensor histidine kinase
MPGALAGSLTLDLDESPSIAGVRRWVADALVGLPEDDVDDCLLVVTELVANAHDHGLAPRGLRLTWSSGPCVLRVEVDDSSPEQPVLGRSRISETRGRGLVIVDRLSVAWGVVGHAHHKTVWAEMACTAVEHSGHAGAGVPVATR